MKKEKKSRGILLACYNQAHKLYETAGVSIFNNLPSYIKVYSNVHGVIFLKSFCQSLKHTVDPASKACWKNCLCKP